MVLYVSFLYTHLADITTKNPTSKSLNAMESIHVFITGYGQGATKCGKKLQALLGELSLEILQSLNDGFLYNSDGKVQTALHLFTPSLRTSLSSEHSRDAVMLSYSEGGLRSFSNTD